MAEWIFLRETWSRRGHLCDPLAATGLRATRGVARAFVDRGGEVPQLQIEIDRGRAARYGLNVADVEDVIETALGGKTATELWEGERRFYVMYTAGVILAVALVVALLVGLFLVFGTPQRDTRAAPLTPWAYVAAALQTVEKEGEA